MPNLGCRQKCTRHMHCMGRLGRMLGSLALGMAKTLLQQRVSPDLVYSNYCTVSYPAVLGVLK